MTIRNALIDEVLGEVIAVLRTCRAPRRSGCRRPASGSSGWRRRGGSRSSGRTRGRAATCRTGRRPCGRTAWRDVPLADRHRAVAGVAEHSGGRGGRLRDAGRVAREAHGDVGQEPHPDGVMVAARQERGPAGRAQGGDVEPVVAQALGRQPVDVRRGSCRSRTQPSWAKPTSSSRTTTTFGEPDRLGSRLEPRDRVLHGAADHRPRLL